MNYEYRCQTCGYRSTSPHFARIGEPLMAPCPHCQDVLRRAVSSPSFHRGLEAHYNHTVGSYVTNDAEMRSELSRKSDAQSERTGADAHYVPVDMRDRDALGVTPDFDPAAPRGLGTDQPV